MSSYRCLLLGNLDPQFRSRIHNIQLLALAKYSTISEYGIDKILEPVIDDIRAARIGELNTLVSVSLPHSNAICHAPNDILHSCLRFLPSLIHVCANFRMVCINKSI